MKPTKIFRALLAIQTFLLAQPLTYVVPDAIHPLSPYTAQINATVSDDLKKEEEEAEEDEEEEMIEEEEQIARNADKQTKEEQKPKKKEWAWQPLNSQ